MDPRQSDSGLRPPLHNTSSPRDNEPDDVEKLKKWQEDRIARKLRGEYQSAVLHLNELVNGNLNTPLRLASVRVEGAKNTRKSFLGFLIEPIVAPTPSEEQNLENVLYKVRRIGHILQETDIFKTVEAQLERTSDNLANPNDVDIVFKTREKGRLYVSSSTELGNNEGNASATGRIRNVFGGAETLEANLSLGTKTKRSFRAALSAPLTSTLQTRGELSVFGLSRDNTTFASCSEDLRGLKAVVRNGDLTRGGVHEFTYEAVLRHIGGLTATASMSMRGEAGTSTKSSISHSWVRDTRDDKLAGTRGYYVKTLNELAGLGGDAKFYKIDAEGQVSRPLIPGASLSLAARSGLLYNLSPSSHFSDRFQLGGPTSIRSFRANSLGPRDGSDSLGGDLYWSLGASVISNIPKKPHWPVKTHLWVNAGRLDALNTSQPLSTNLKNLISQPSVSAGFGFVYRFDPIRVEVNLGVPLVANRSDGMRRGVQVGMGLEFL